MKVIDADTLKHRQHFLSKIPYDQRKTNKKLTYEIDMKNIQAFFRQPGMNVFHQRFHMAERKI